MENDSLSMPPILEYGLQNIPYSTEFTAEAAIVLSGIAVLFALSSDPNTRSRFWNGTLKIFAILKNSSVLIVSIFKKYTIKYRYYANAVLIRNISP